MKLSIIVAVAENGVIGRGGELPWRLPADLAHFRKLTMGHAIVMGRRTYESIGRQLPGRRMIVVTRQPDYEAAEVELASDLDRAIELAQSVGDGEIFFIGGTEIFKQVLPLADRIYLTRVHASVEGDTHFPDVDWAEWHLLESVRHDADSKNEYPLSFEIYERR